MDATTFAVCRPFASRRPSTLMQMLISRFWCSGLERRGSGFYAVEAMVMEMLIYNNEKCSTTWLLLIKRGRGTPPNQHQLVSQAATTLSGQALAAIRTCPPVFISRHTHTHTLSEWPSNEPINLATEKIKI